MGKSLLTKDKTEKRGECMWGLPVLRILLVRAFNPFFRLLGIVVVASHHEMI
jgi:hypothetical protein